AAGDASGDGIHRIVEVREVVDDDLTAFAESEGERLADAGQEVEGSSHLRGIRHVTCLMIRHVTCLRHRGFLLSAAVRLDGCRMAVGQSPDAGPMTADPRGSTSSGSLAHYFIVGEGGPSEFVRQVNRLRGARRVAAPPERTASLAVCPS